MPSNYRTIFVESTEANNRGILKDHRREINGDQLARDVQAAILEQEQDKMELISTSPITSTLTNGRVFTQGVLLIFRRIVG